MRRISLVPVVLTAALSSPAYADSFAEVVGGVMLPVADDDWTNYVDSGPKLGVRFGSVGNRVGGMLSADWTPIAADDDGFLGADVSAHRFRILLNATTHVPVGSTLVATGRVGGGLDLAYVHIDAGFLGETSDTDPGIAVEAAAGLWFKLGSLHVGGELALPMSFHSDDADDEIDLNDYTSFDVDILFGIRLMAD